MQPNYDCELLTSLDLRLTAHQPATLLLSSKKGAMCISVTRRGQGHWPCQGLYTRAGVSETLRVCGHVNMVSHSHIFVAERLLMVRRVVGSIDVFLVTAVLHDLHKRVVAANRKE